MRNYLGLHSWSKKFVGFIVSTYTATCLAYTSVLHAQSLNEAVNQQLNFGSFDCELLLNGDPSNVNLLTGELANICQRGEPAGSGSGSSSAAGGGAAASTSMPTVAKRRLELEHETTEAPLRGFFFSVSAGTDDRETTELQDRYTSDINALLLGFDQEFGNTVAGISFEYAAQDGDFLLGGNFRDRSVGVTGFGGHSISDSVSANFFIAINQHSNERTRAANFIHLDNEGLVFFQSEGLPEAELDTREVRAGAQLTYTHSIGNVSVGPKAALDWRQSELSSYAESELVDSGLALTFHDDSYTSLISTLGIDASVAISTNFGVVVISEHFYWLHEFEDRQRDIEVSFVGDSRNQRFSFQSESPDTDFYKMGIDAMLLFHGGLQVFASYETLASHRFRDTNVFSAGLRKEF